MACALAGCVAWFQPAGADAPAGPFHSDGVWFLPYEPSTIGETFDSDDVAFTDVTLSLKYPILPRKMKEWTRGDDQVFLAYTGRFGFYWGGRDSAPVIGKRYNPKFLWQHAMDWDGSSGNAFRPKLALVGLGDSGDVAREYLELAYAHESNGQPINTLEQYDNAVASALKSDHDAAFAKDYISRGWDYLGLTGKAVPLDDEAKGRLSGYLRLRYFLPHGLFQGPPEELHDWEQVPDAKPRKAVNGIDVMAKYEWHTHRAHPDSVLGDMKVAADVETGYQPVFKYGTLKLEVGIQVLQLPITLWWRSGYNSDLAQYYKKVTSWGLQLDIGSF